MTRMPRKEKEINACEQCEVFFCFDNSPVYLGETLMFNAAPDGQDYVVFMGHHSSLSIGYEL